MVRNLHWPRPVFSVKVFIPRDTPLSIYPSIVLLFIFEGQLDIKMVSTIVYLYGTQYTEHSCLGIGRYVLVSLKLGQEHTTCDNVEQREYLVHVLGLQPYASSCWPL